MNNPLNNPLDDLSVAGSLSRQVLCLLLDGGEGIKGMCVVCVAVGCMVYEQLIWVKVCVLYVYSCRVYGI